MSNTPEMHEPRTSANVQDEHEGSVLQHHRRDQFEQPFYQHSQAASGTDRAAYAKSYVNDRVQLTISTNERARAGVEQSRKIDAEDIFGTDVPQPSLGALGPSGNWIRIWPCDTLMAAYLLRKMLKQEQNSKIAILNFANPDIPGGGLLSGSIAQEESLCLRSTLHAGLKQEFYPLGMLDLIHTPDVLVTELEISRTLETRKWFFVDVISCAAHYKLLSKDTKHMMDDSLINSVYSRKDDREDMRIKIVHILRLAAEIKATAVVLGAFGCGAFGHPPHGVANLIKESLLRLHDWRGTTSIKQVIIAIDDQDPKQDVWRAFATVFDEPPRGGVLIDKTGNEMIAQSL